MTRSEIWYVAYTKQRQEALAQAQLERQGYVAYLPCLKTYKTKLFHAANSNLPTEFVVMFPRYLFFRPLSSQQSIGSVRSTIGISHVIRFGHEPAQVSQDLIDRIKYFEAQQHLGNFADVGPFQPGILVHVTRGPFAGHEGIVSKVSSKRVEILMELLGRENVIRLNPADLKPL